MTMFNRNPAFIRISALLSLRNKSDRISTTLRHGRLFVREIGTINSNSIYYNNHKEEIENQMIDQDDDDNAYHTFEGVDFLAILDEIEHEVTWRIPSKGHFLAFSRLHFDQEIVVVINTNTRLTQSAYVTLDAEIQRKNNYRKLEYLYHSEWESSAFLKMMEHRCTYRDEANRIQTAKNYTDANANATKPRHCLGAETARMKSGRTVTWISLPPCGMAILF